MTTKIATKALSPRPMVMESTYSSRNLGKHASTMTLFADGPHYFIEWDVPTLDEVVHIGLTFEHKQLQDYDGCFSLPKEAIAFLREQGFVVPRDFDA